MSDRPPKVIPAGADNLLDTVRRKAARKLRAQRAGSQGWLGLGMAGLIGWSVAVPTLVGALAGLWLDRHHPGRHSWTLTLLVTGLILGAVNAGRWLAQQDQAITAESKGDDE